MITGSMNVKRKALPLAIALNSRTASRFTNLQTYRYNTKSVTLELGHQIIPSPPVYESVTREMHYKLNCTMTSKSIVLS